MLLIETNSKSKHSTIHRTNAQSYKVVMYIPKLHHFCNTSPLMMTRSRAESTWEINNYGTFIHQFSPNIIKSIRQYKRINKKICRQKMYIMFNEICINDDMLLQYIYIYIYIYIYMCVCVCVCVCVYFHLIHSFSLRGQS